VIGIDVWRFLSRTASVGVVFAALLLYLCASAAAMQRENIGNLAPDAGATFGAAIAADGDVLVVGEPGASRVHVFQQSNGEWRRSAVIEPPADDAQFGPDRPGFGYSVAVKGGLIGIGGFHLSAKAADDRVPGGDGYLRRSAIYALPAQDAESGPVLLSTESLSVEYLFGVNIATDGNFIAAGLQDWEPARRGMGAVGIFSLDAGFKRAVGLDDASSRKLGSIIALDAGHLAVAVLSGPKAGQVLIEDLNFREQGFLKRTKEALAAGPAVNSLSMTWPRLFVSGASEEQPIEVYRLDQDDEAAPEAFIAPGGVVAASGGVLAVMAAPAESPFGGHSQTKPETWLHYYQDLMAPVGYQQVDRFSAGTVSVAVNDKNLFAAVHDSQSGNSVYAYRMSN
jgi:hypothetical protein